MRPIKDLYDAVVMPFKALFVVGLCWVISHFTGSGDWWKWVALGMGIAVAVSFARGARTLLVLAIAGWFGWKIYQRWGPDARRRFDEWVRQAQPQAAEVMDAFRRDGGQAFAIENEVRH